MGQLTYQHHVVHRLASQTINIHLRIERFDKKILAWQIIVKEAEAFSTGSNRPMWTLSDPG